MEQMMKVRVKFYCSCDAYIDEIVDPEFEPIENSDKPVFQISYQHAACESCGKAHEISMYHSQKNKILTLADNDVEDFEYEIVFDNNDNS